MPTMHDTSGAITTIANATALAHWDDTIEHVLAHAAAAPAALAATLKADPSFVLGHAVKGLMILTLARSEMLDDARGQLVMARRLDGSAPVSERERCYMTALEHWLGKRPDLAAQALDAAIRADRHDVLAAKLAHAIRFMMGDLRGMLSAARDHMDLHGLKGPHSGYLLGCLAFSHEENGDYRQAERLGRHALEMSPRDAWARHSVAHVMEMTGRAQEGIGWLAQGREHSLHCNNFAFHLAWHEALFNLELGNTSAALRLYDQDIRARKTDDYRDIANAASLLQRLEFAGIPVGHRWHELADLASNRVTDRALVFADLHYALALMGAGREDDAEHIHLNLSQDASSGHDGQLARCIGAPVTAAIRAFRARRFSEATRLMLTARPLLQSIGGSHAQRDIFEQLLIESAIRSGDIALATRLLEQRLVSRGGQNRFAAQRLGQIAQANRKPAMRLAAALVAMAPSPAVH